MRWAVQKPCRKQGTDLWQSENTKMRVLCSARQEQNREVFFFLSFIGCFFPQMIDYYFVLLLADKTQFLYV